MTGKDGASWRCRLLERRIVKSVASYMAELIAGKHPLRMAKTERSNKVEINQPPPLTDLKSFSISVFFCEVAIKVVGWEVKENRKQAITVTLPFNLHPRLWWRMKCSGWNKESQPSLKWFVYALQWEAAWMTNLGDDAINRADTVPPYSPPRRPLYFLFLF